MVELLTTARALIDDPGSGPVGVWPRAAAFLARQELEGALHRLWQRNIAGVEKASVSSQLSCLGYLSPDPSLAADVRSAWLALTRACHLHQFELAPTAPELHHWIDQVEHLVDILARSETS